MIIRLTASANWRMRRLFAKQLEPALDLYTQIGYTVIKRGTRRSGSLFAVLRNCRCEAVLFVQESKVPKMRKRCFVLTFHEMREYFRAVDEVSAVANIKINPTRESLTSYPCEFHFEDYDGNRFRYVLADDVAIDPQLIEESNPL